MPLFSPPGQSQGLGQSLVARKFSSPRSHSILSVGSDISRAGSAVSFYEETVHFIMKEGSVWASALNLVLCQLGMSTLVLPAAMAIVGWAQAFLLFLVFFALSLCSLFLMEKTCQALPGDSEVHSIGHLMTSIYGRNGALGMEFLMFLMSLGCEIFFLGVIGIQLQAVAEALAGPELPMSLLSNPSVTTIMCAVAFGVIGPISLLPPESVRHVVSTTATGCMLFVMLTITLEAPWRAAWPPMEACAGASDPNLEPADWLDGLPRLLKAIPLFVFSFNGPTGYLPVRHQLIAESFDPLRGVSLFKACVLMLVGQSIVLLNYLVTSFMGYLTFCGDTKQNVMDGYDVSQPCVVVAKAALALQLTCSCIGVWTPLNRASVWSLVGGLHAPMPHRAKVLLTFVCLAGPVAISASLGGRLALPMGLTSSVCLTAFCLVLPGVVAARTNALGRKVWQRAIPSLYALFGAVLGIGCTVPLLMPSSQP